MRISCRSSFPFLCTLLASCWFEDCYCSCFVCLIENISACSHRVTPSLVRLLLCVVCCLLLNGVCIAGQESCVQSDDPGYDLASCVVRIECKRMRNDARMHLHVMPAACFGCVVRGAPGRCSHCNLSCISSELRAEPNEQELARIP